MGSNCLLLMTVLLFSFLCLEISATNEEIAKAQLDIALYMVREANKLHPGQSSMVSPFSINVLLSMLLLGARKWTEAELRTVMGGGSTQKEIHEYFRTVIQHINGENYPFQITNDLFLREDLKLKHNFWIRGRVFYNVAAKKMNFSDAQLAADTINKRVAKITKGRINQIISKSDFDEYTRLIILNVLYFKARWSRPFLKEDTIEGFFHRSDTEKISASFMRPPYGGSVYEFYNGDVFNCLKLPFKGDKVSAYLILPRTRFGLNEVIKDLNADVLLNAIRSLDKMFVEVKIPKFKLHSDNDVKDLLKEKLTTTMSSYSNFEGIVKRGFFDLDLNIDQFKQQVDFEINEDGAEGVSATVFSVESRSDDKPEFIADEPFLFLLADKQPTPTIYFAGVIYL